MGLGGGWEVEGGQHHPQGGKRQCYSCNIRDEVYRGWTGGRGAGWVLGVVGKLKAGNTIHKEANGSAVSSVGHRNYHSQPGRTRQSSAAAV